MTKYFAPLILTLALAAPLSAQDLDSWLEKENLSLDAPQPRPDEGWFPRVPTTEEFLNWSPESRIAYLTAWYAHQGGEHRPCWPEDHDYFSPREIVWGLLKDLSEVPEAEREEWLQMDAGNRIFMTCFNGHPEDRVANGSGGR